MSDRGTIVFRKDGEKSVVISSYFGSTGFVDTARFYAIELKKEVDGLIALRPNQSTPLTRLEPAIIAVDFLRYLCEKGWIDGRDSGIYLYRDEKEAYGDVVVIDLDKPESG